MPALQSLITSIYQLFSGNESDPDTQPTESGSEDDDGEKHRIRAQVSGPRHTTTFVSTKPVLAALHPDQFYRRRMYPVLDDTGYVLTLALLLRCRRSLLRGQDGMFVVNVL